MPLGDAIARAVAGTPSLRAAMINILMGDAGAAAISQAHKLQLLDLAFDDVTDARLAALGQLNNLRRLHLEGRGRLSDVGLASLGNLSRLTDLALPADGLTDAGLARLAPLVTLSTLKLPNGRFDGSGLAALDRLTQLRRFELDGSPFDDLGCRLLPRVFPRLSAHRLEPHQSYRQRPGIDCQAVSTDRFDHRRNRDHRRGIGRIEAAGENGAAAQSGIRTLRPMVLRS